MTLFILGLLLFFIPHFYSAFRDRSPEKDIKKRLGYGPYMGLYSVVSLIGFVLIIMGYGAMRPSAVIFTAPVWGQHVNLILMIPAMIFLIASQLPPGHIKLRLKHPMLLAIKIWALGHLLANGELNALLLFGAFLVYAIIDRIAVKKRGGNGPTDVVANAKWDILSVVIGLGAYAVLVIYLHGVLFGVPVY